MESCFSVLDVALACHGPESVLAESRDSTALGGGRLWQIRISGRPE